MAESNLSSTALKFLVDHFSLPPKLPEKDDFTLKHEADVKKESLKWMEESAKLFGKFLGKGGRTMDPEWQLVATALEDMRYSTGDVRGLSEIRLKESLAALRKGGALMLHVEAQNAGVLFHNDGDGVVVSCFEASPNNAAVLACQGALLRNFPSMAIRLSAERFGDDDFCTQLAETLARLSQESIAEALPKAKKAGVGGIVEDRDTTSPIFVTDFLFGILIGLGEVVEHYGFSKRYRDDIIDSKSHDPWRRSPFLLVIKVSLQLLLHNPESKHQHLRYKSFMAFLHSRILNEHVYGAAGSQASNEDVYILGCKVARRLKKLEGETPDELIVYLKELSQGVKERMGRSWTQLEFPKAEVGVLNALPNHKDTNLRMTHLKSYISSMSANRYARNHTPTHLSRRVGQRIDQSGSLLPDAVALSDDFDFYEVPLRDLESWVRCQLDSWIERNIGPSRSRGKVAEQFQDSLCTLLEAYLARAQVAYKGFPEDISVMILTGFHIWMALDKASIKHSGLLAQYDPGFDLSIFNGLLLPELSQLQQLSKIKIYIHNRKKQANPAYPSPFDAEITSNALLVQYYSGSVSAIKLRQRIEQDARVSRELKKSEFRQNMQQYESLMAQYHAIAECDLWTNYHNGRQRHHNRCKKCAIMSSAKRISIDIHEWPLPADENWAKAAVADISLDGVVSRWRDFTYCLLFNPFTGFSESAPVFQPNQQCDVSFARRYVGLQTYVTSRDARICLGSQAKSFLTSHYSKPLAVTSFTEDNICRPNALQYKVYDTAGNCWMGETMNPDSARKMFEPQLETDEYRALQFALVGTEHSSNEVIAKQSLCHRDINLHEFNALGVLRSGNRLQWRSLAKEITSQIINFDSPDVHTFVLQTAWQMEQQSMSFDIIPISHKDLEEERFSIELLGALAIAVDNLKSNWKSVTAMRGYVLLANRVYSLSPHSDVKKRALETLLSARRYTHDWIRKLLELRDSTRGASVEDRKQSSFWIVEVAVTCLATFNAERVHSGQESAEAIAIAVECAIRARMNMASDLSNYSLSARVMVRRFHRLLHSLENSIVERIRLGDDSGISLGVSTVYASLDAKSSWEASKDRSGWITTPTSNGTRIISLNLLDGRLLVDGVPISRLPGNYETSDIYKRLFGERVLEVVPSKARDMQFMTSVKHFGHLVHFGKTQNDEVIIRTYFDGDWYTYIPHETFRHDIPVDFADEYVHWMFESNDGYCSIHFNQMEKTFWDPKLSRWTMNLERYNLNAKVHLRNTHGRGKFFDLVEPKSSVGKHICEILSPIETAEYIQIRLDHNMQAYINLPRLGLDFRILPNSKRLHCQNYDMMLDLDQNVGTLTGLKSKLVLRRDLHGSERSVLIPYGNVLWRKTVNHVEVEIQTGTENVVKYAVYPIESYLKRLRNSGNIRAQLFKTYLHAVTSHCLPDSLTGRTGTEEALRELSSARLRSFESLGEEELRLLELLGKLTPIRKYYPVHRQNVQNVRWDEQLPALSQHERFLTLVNTITEQFKRQQVFSGNELAAPSLETISQLQDRAAIRNAHYYIDIEKGEPSSSTYDKTYLGRDCCEYERQERVASIAQLVDSWAGSLNTSLNLLQLIEQWGGQVTGKEGDAYLQGSSYYLGFDATYLHDPKTWLPTQFCSRQRSFSQLSVTNKYSLSFFLSTMAFSKNANLPFIHSLLAMATVPEIGTFTAPEGPFKLGLGYKPNRTLILNAVSGHFLKLSFMADEDDLEKEEGETLYAHNFRKEVAFAARQSEKATTVVNEIMRCWDSGGTPNFKDLHGYISEPTQAEELLYQWRRNLSFRQYISKIQAVLTHTFSHFAASQITTDRIKHHANVRPTWTPTEATLQSRFLDIAPFTNATHKAGQPLKYEDVQNQDISNRPRISIKAYDGVSEGYSRMRLLLGRLKESATLNHERRYLHDLNESFEALCDRDMAAQKESSTAALISDFVRKTEEYQSLCHRRFQDLEDNLIGALGPRTVRDGILSNLGLWPRLSRTAILGQLCLKNSQRLSETWRKSIVAFGTSLSNLQRADRIHDLAMRYGMNGANDIHDLKSELSNIGHTNWNVDNHPEWLLFELENNILIRPQQIDIARLMIQPVGNSNEVMQLNMGEGKTSVIAPIVAASLADSKKLVRIFVLRALSAQMFELLAQKLGGLLNRRIFYLPFSRNIKLDREKLNMIEELFQECLETGGILLTQPEHVLSFELMGYERMLAGDTAVGEECLRIQSWLQWVTRDVLDESDELLSVKFELIYTIGNQMDIEFAPERWKVATKILSSVRSNAARVKRYFPEDVDLADGGKVGNFPRMRFYSKNSQDYLLQLVVDDICRGRVRIGSSRLRAELVRKLITSPTVSAADMEHIKELTDGSSDIYKSLLVLRGLLTCGILRFALGEKRYRVNYGLDLTRSLLAVPFRAKDSPAARAEFSHPDVIIVLTALCYYYEGLTDEQLLLCFKKLLTLETCEDEYSLWVDDSLPTLDRSFRSHKNINLKDMKTCTNELFPNFRYAKSVVDFYLSHIVFPKEAKEYPFKLSASGWDLAKKKTLSTTGFSGTNDSRYLLPLSIEQCENPSQKHTNAGVLDCVLRAENVYMDMRWDANLDTERLISNLPLDIRVIIDVGAQILDLKNEEVAQYWLESARRNKGQYYDAKPPKAVVYFNEDNQLMVYSTNKVVELLSLSPYAKQLDHCLVYLDEAHTRGTDLQLPSHYKAAVTLGPSLTKDRLVQACMRMRKLGKGQSLVFIAPPEVRKSIFEATKRPPSTRIEVIDILQWSISETCKHARRSLGLWYTQGVRHIKQSVVHKDVQDEVRSYNVEDVRSLLGKEARSLESRYGDQDAEAHVEIDEESLTIDGIQNLMRLRQRCEDIGLLSIGEATMLQEEQERELSPEAEREVEAERPPARTALRHSLHRDVLTFVQTGEIPSNTSAFRPAFKIFEQTSANIHSGSAYALVASKTVLVSSDFAVTVKNMSRTLGNQLDSYLRPVNWILTSSKNSNLLVVITPYEANAILSSVQLSDYVRLHVYSPRVHRSGEPLDTLDRFVFSNRKTVLNHLTLTPILQPALQMLNLFAGQVYFESHKSYLDLCSLLGLAPTSLSDIQTGLDGFLKRHQRNRPSIEGIDYSKCLFLQSPVKFLSSVLALRRKGMSTEGTDMGDLLSGIPLSKEAFEGRVVKVEEELTLN